MNLKKIIAAVSASVMVLSTTAFSAFAQENATLCFDTNDSIVMFTGYGAVGETGFTASIDTAERVSGNGSLALTENVSASVDSDNRSGGLYIESESLGLDSFAGCTLTMSVLFNEEAAKLAEGFTIFADGIVWMTCDVGNENAGKWTEVSFSIPENAANTRIGFAIPVYEGFSGTVANIDNLMITKADGTAVANIGDVKEASKIEVSIGTAPRIILLVVACLLIVAVIAGIGFIVSKFQSRFTQ